ncbi:YoaK family protein [Microvirga pudoricolor]|uniref:YoaK family protein n=1 Tax=Microvirga pudoricolor TaxID=2778729 RepID=UPI001951D4FD|nr:YoaK family protein [Microvirga pudoricolor]MBM6594195.1 DUF1275 domain-containing protein [Microvirga pudoricolor]
MKGTSRPEATVALLLAGTAGYVDGMGFLHLGGLFVSFMTGNSTRLGVSLAEGRWGEAGLAAGILALFVVGATTGALIGGGGTPSGRRRVLVAVGALLAAAALSEGSSVRGLSIAAMVLAMGIENAVFQKNGETGIGLTYMTGTLVRAGQRIAAALRGGPPLAWTSSITLWASLTAGALVGAWSYAQVGMTGLWVPAGLAFMLAGVAPLLGPGRDSDRSERARENQR